MAKKNGNKDRLIPLPPVETRQGLRDFKVGRLWHINFTLLDMDGPFKWPTNSSESSNLLSWLAELNRKSDRRSLEVDISDHDKGTIHHSVPIGQCSKEAQSRFGELRSNPKWAQRISEDLLRLRYCLAPNSTQRVWGYMADPDAGDGFQSVFYPIWWDPQHKVQAEKKSTGKVGSCFKSGCFHL